MSRTRSGQPAYAAIPHVDLMPRVETERRSRAALWRIWGWVIVGALAIVVILAALMFWLRWAAEQQLAAEQVRTQALISELASLSDVSAALAAQAELESFAAEAGSAAPTWSATLAAVSTVLPAGVALSGFDLNVGGIATTTPEESAGVDGTLTLQSPTPVDIAPAIRAIRALPGVIAADGREVTSTVSEPVVVEGEEAVPAGRLYAYELTITFDQTVYAGSEG